MEDYAHAKRIFSRQSRKRPISVQVSVDLAIAIRTFVWAVPNDKFQFVNRQLVADALKYGLVGALRQLIMIALDQDDIAVQPLSALN